MKEIKNKNPAIAKRSIFRSTLSYEERLYLLLTSKYKNKGIVKFQISQIEDMMEY